MYQNGAVTRTKIRKQTKDERRHRSRSRLISRTPRARPEESRRYPRTTVLIPASLHSDSSYSLFSAIDIDQDPWYSEECLDDVRAPRAYFRRSYILSDTRDLDNDDEESVTPAPAVTLTVSPLYILYPRPESTSSSNISSVRTSCDDLLSHSSRHGQQRNNLSRERIDKNANYEAQPKNYSLQSLSEYQDKVSYDKIEKFENHYEYQCSNHNNTQCDMIEQGSIHENPLYNVDSSHTTRVQEEVSSLVSGQSSTKQPWSGGEGGGSDIPMAVGIMVATVVGTPVFFAAGIKLGLFAGIAGGAMGYTTGKMFADHE